MILSATATSSTLVEAPARLHLGFLDPSATLGRRFASLGLVIEGMSASVAIAAAPGKTDNEIIAASALVPADHATRCGGRAAPDSRERLARYVALLQNASGLRQPLRVTLHNAPPAHAGFGSGTQLALAVGRAFADFHGLALDSRQIAGLLGRGERSGIGIAGFDQGGLLLDGGPGAAGSVAPLLARAAFPRDWRVLLVLDCDLDGLHGAAERSAMGSLPPFPRALAAELCHQVLMCVLPAAVESVFAPFAEGVSTVQQLIGDYFAPAQGGSMYTSAAVARLLEWIRPRYCAGIGQSSWGPTGFAFLPSAAAADAVIAAAHAAGVVAPEIRLQVVRGNNQGALVTTQSADWSPRLAAAPVRIHRPGRSFPGAIL
ncbi:MAG TPA: beta-ribofuranosylaminobenzene 5'-phosphate synthase family protein [Rhodocyclaceae bacterium]|nr:beta-ribofuranosylaminobenzene 5'-phosphate synthase family protein [Rhodocyclaceae bacterium]